MVCRVLECTYLQFHMVEIIDILAIAKGVLGVRMCIWERRTACTGLSALANGVYGVEMYIKIHIVGYSDILAIAKGVMGV